MSDDIFIKKMQDIVRLCEKYHTPRFSKFLDEKEQALLKKEGILGGILFGGYENAERCMLGVFPKWQEPDTSYFPIKVLEFTKKYDKEITHRNYLGTILSLGIERSKIGDILAGDKVSYVFVSEDISEFIKDNIRKVSGCGVDIRMCGFDEITVPERRFELIDAVAASLRADAVLAALLKISRSDAKAFILSGKVSVNHSEISGVDFLLKEGDLLSVRGFGRAELFEVGNKTRSDRIHVTLRKYI
ncbi:MAG: hypothetical protein J6C82_08035 [Clostridia bacterium]|nr:hypothetical protein [Clostridia bacterium]